MKPIVNVLLKSLSITALIVFTGAIQGAGLSAPQEVCLKPKGDCFTDTPPPPSDTNTSTNKKPQTRGYYIMVSRRDLSDLDIVKAHPSIQGIVKNYPMKSMNPRRGEFDFTEVERDLAYMKSLNKKLGMQVMVMAYARSGIGYLPDYMLAQANYDLYKGGVLVGEEINHPNGIAIPPRYHVPGVGDRMNDLIVALGKKFDNDPDFEMIIFQESSFPIKCPAVPAYSAEKYWDFLTKRIDVAAKSFPKTRVIQRVNYWPCMPGTEMKPWTDKLMTYAASKGVGTGGPDIHLNRPKSNLEASVFPMHRYLDENQPELARGISIQWDNYETSTVKAMIDFARKDIKVDYLTILPRNSPETWWDDGVIPYMNQNPKF